ncbi:MAG: HEPN domain-containing protein [Chitinophagaceae bacterium]|nr:MAG: HEPN domain-containing protein [Chitinophagaceae bacterium]
MQNLLKSKDYSWSLFLGHLVIEKLLKAHYVKKFQTHAVFTHDLLRLAKKTELDLPANYLDWLDEITTFNLNTRYPDYKQNFYKLCTKKFTFTQIERIESIRTWLKNQF